MPRGRQESSPSPSLLPKCEHHDISSPRYRAAVPILHMHRGKGEESGRGSATTTQVLFLPVLRPGAKPPGHSRGPVEECTLHMPRSRQESSLRAPKPPRLHYRCCPRWRASCRSPPPSPAPRPSSAQQPEVTPASQRALHMRGLSPKPLVPFRSIPRAAARERERQCGAAPLRRGRRRPFAGAGGARGERDARERGPGGRARACWRVASPLPSRAGLLSGRRGVRRGACVAFSRRAPPGRVHPAASEGTVPRTPSRGASPVDCNGPAAFFLPRSAWDG